MKINEVFLSLQGEGKLLGTPSIFIRTMGCPLKCIYCDSTGASRNIDEPNYDINTKEEIQAFCDEIFDKYKGNKCNSVVLTGGEPLMKQNWEQLKLLTYFIATENHYSLNIETTMIPDVTVMKNENVFSVFKRFMNKMNDFSEDAVNNFTINNHFNSITISPKLDPECYYTLLSKDDIIKYYSPGNEDELWYFFNEWILEYKITHYKNIEEQILKLVDKFKSYTGHKYFEDYLYIMPKTPIGWNYNRDAWRESCLETVEFCKKYGLRYTPRLQIDLYDLEKEK